MDVVTDAEGKNVGSDEEDATRPAVPSPPPLDGYAKDDAEASEIGLRRGPASLRRVEPEEGKGGVVALSADSYVLGRSHTCEIPLLSATASRQHARILHLDGGWFLCPVGGKTVIVDGHPTQNDVRLRHEMTIRLGADELVFLQEETGVDEAESEEETLVTAAENAEAARVADDESRRPPMVWVAIGVAAVLLVGLAFWLLL